MHCAASGLRYRPLLPIWGEEAITLQPIRTGFPCFGAALAGYVEATLDGDDEKNRLCPPSPLSNTPADWARMQVLGYQAAMSFAARTRTSKPGPMVSGSTRLASSRTSPARPI